ncbi:unnamed protein product [Aspergillus oryzae]|uniref:Unnamed protein product n=1 Tax=Aspergillus oryzae TaxID=5062 RepID=A0AAN4YJ06_ASPOZ|nr:unnamed protein product [Aspergillus oryzae]
MSPSISCEIGPGTVCGYGITDVVEFSSVGNIGSEAHIVDNEEVSHIHIESKMDIDVVLFFHPGDHAFDISGVYADLVLCLLEF